MAAKKTPKDIYTDPDLRHRLKDEITAGDKGGRPGQWSARKAQLLVHEYEKAGGGYKEGGQTDAQKHLHEWTEEDWTTADGKPAGREDGMHRYLPKDAWDKLTPEEQAATDKQKLEGDHAGHQFVPNTEEAKEAREDAQKHK